MGLNKCKHGFINNECSLCLKVIKVQNSSVQVYFVDKTDSTMRRLKNLTDRVFRSNEECHSVAL